MPRATIALVQMRCVESKDANVGKALARIAEAAAAGANIVCLQELFAGHYPCQTEDHRRFEDAEPIPGPTYDALVGRRETTQSRDRRLTFRTPSPRTCITTRPSCSMPTARSRAVTARCTSPTIRTTTKNSISRPGDLGFRSLPTQVRRRRTAGLLGPMVSRSGPARRPWPGAAFGLSDRHRLAGQGKRGVRRQPTCGLGNDDAQPRHRQRRVRGRHQSNGHGKMRLSFGAPRSFAIRMATCWPERGMTRKKHCSSSAISLRSTRFAPIGHSSATGGSTPTPISPAAISIDTLLKKGTGSEQSSGFFVESTSWRSACPLFQQPPRVDSEPCALAERVGRKTTHEPSCPRPPNSAIACPPNGSRTPRHGFPGRTGWRHGPDISHRFRSFMPAWCASWPRSSTSTFLPADMPWPRPGWCCAGLPT